jgi:hypothetical protein
MLPFSPISSTQIFISIVFITTVIFSIRLPLTLSCACIFVLKSSPLRFLSTYSFTWAKFCKFHLTCTILLTIKVISFETQTFNQYIFKNGRRKLLPSPSFRWETLYSKSSIISNLQLVLNKWKSSMLSLTLQEAVNSLPTHQR